MLDSGSMPAVAEELLAGAWSAMQKAFPAELPNLGQQPTELKGTGHFASGGGGGGDLAQEEESHNLSATGEEKQSEGRLLRPGAGPVADGRCHRVAAGVRLSAARARYLSEASDTLFLLARAAGMQGRVERQLELLRQAVAAELQLLQGTNLPKVRHLQARVALSSGLIRDQSDSPFPKR